MSNVKLLWTMIVYSNASTCIYINLVQITNFYFYFYQILTAFNKLKIMSEVARTWQLKSVKLAFW
jgi:hypothetical protein